MRRATLALLALLAGCGDGADQGEPSAAAGKPASKWAHVASLDPPATCAPLREEALGTLGETSPALPADESRYEVWTFQGKPGDLVTIRMESESFDPYLALLRETGLGTEVFALDDDSGGGATAEIRCELPESGSYWVVANAALRDGEGPYRLRFESSGLPDFPAGDPAERYALLVGVGDYPESRFDLPADSTDLALIHEALVTGFGFREENVVTLRNREATKTRVMHAFRGHLGRAGDEGLALFYFTGHGIKTHEDAVIRGELLDPDEGDGDEALLLADGSYLYDDEVGFLGDRLQASRVVFILDCCYAASASRGGPRGWTKGIAHNEARGFLKSTGTSSARTGEPVGDPGRHLLLAASLPDQEARVLPEIPGLGAGSAFTYHLARALRSAPADLTFGSLMRDVSTTTATLVEDSLDVPQNPVIAGSWQDERVADMLGAP